MGTFVDTREILASIGVHRELPTAATGLIEYLSGLRRLGSLCTGVGVTRSNADVSGQISDVFAAAGIRYTVTHTAPVAQQGESPAASGPVIFYGNHPFGIADALIGLQIALALRPDTKALANGVLGSLDINRDRIIWIDPFDSESRSGANRRGLRDALRHLRGGGALLMFPAGTCSHLHLRQGRITDPPWSQHLARFVAATAALVVPIYFAGHNSWRFQLAGLVHPMLRTLLLLREFLSLSGKHLQVRVGPPARHDEEHAGDSIERQTGRLRALVYDLGVIR